MAKACELVVGSVFKFQSDDASYRVLSTVKSPYPGSVRIEFEDLRTGQYKCEFMPGTLLISILLQPHRQQFVSN